MLVDENEDGEMQLFVDSRLAFVCRDCWSARSITVNIAFPLRGRVGEEEAWFDLVFSGGVKNGRVIGSSSARVCPF